eukprot:3939858-Rhodomonas_salina.1
MVAPARPDVDSVAVSCVRCGRKKQGKTDGRKKGWMDGRMGGWEEGRKDVWRGRGGRGEGRVRVEHEARLVVDRRATESTG